MRTHTRQKVGNFTYFKTRINGMTATNIYFCGNPFEKRVEYKCLNCGRPVELIYRETMQDVTRKNFDEMTKQVLCNGCHRVAK